MAKGNSIRPVTVVTDEDLVQNGGQYYLRSGPALRVVGKTSAGNNEKLQGGPTQPVYVLNDSDLVENGGDFYTVGETEPVKIGVPTDFGQQSRPVIGGPAQPVYVTNGDNWPAPFDKNRIVSHWSLEEPSGTRFDDSANNNDLTDNNTVGVTGAIVGSGSAHVRSNAETLSISSNSTLNFGGQSFSIACWAYFDSLPSVSGIISKSSSEYLVALLGGGNVPSFGIDASGLKIVSSSQTVTTATWYYIVCVYDRPNPLIAGDIKISVDAGAFDTLGGNGDISTTANDFVLGGITTSINPLDGRLDQVLLIREALTIDAVGWLYNNRRGRSWGEIQSL